jgi:hypothetical protein
MEDVYIFLKSVRWERNFQTSTCHTTLCVTDYLRLVSSPILNSPWELTASDEEMARALIIVVSSTSVHVAVHNKRLVRGRRYQR